MTSAEFGEYGVLNETSTRSRRRCIQRIREIVKLNVGRTKHTEDSEKEQHWKALADCSLNEEFLCNYVQ